MLEEMGISIQSSGIAVEKNKFYLVNLNADPSLNELLVYYLKVGRTWTETNLKNSNMHIFLHFFTYQCYSHCVHFLTGCFHNEIEVNVTKKLLKYTFSD